jgi:hypothetical protein
MRDDEEGQQQLPDSCSLFGAAADVDVEVDVDMDTDADVDTVSVSMGRHT